MKTVEYNLRGKGRGARGEENAPSLAPRALPLAPHGFSLTEILIVIALIVLLLALAIPAFSFITGSRSIDGAANQISAFLGRARAEAIGLQEMRGVMFFVDPTKQRTNLAIVHETPERPAVDNPNVDVYLDLVPDAEFLALPPGVSIQTLNDCA